MPGIHPQPGLTHPFQPGKDGTVPIVIFKTYLNHPMGPSPDYLIVVNETLCFKYGSNSQLHLRRRYQHEVMPCHDSITYSGQHISNWVRNSHSYPLSLCLFYQTSVTSLISLPQESDRQGPAHGNKYGTDQTGAYRRGVGHTDNSGDTVVPCILADAWTLQLLIS